MTKYRVHAGVHGGKYIGDFEADSPDGAITKADEAEALHVSVCWQCADEVGDPEVQTYVIEDLDTGEVFYIGEIYSLRSTLELQKKKITKLTKERNKLTKKVEALQGLIRSMGHHD